MEKRVSLELSPELVIYKNVVEMVETQIVVLENQIKEIEVFIGYCNNLIKYAEKEIKRLEADNKKPNSLKYTALLMNNENKIGDLKRSIIAQESSIKKYERNIKGNEELIRNLKKQLTYQTNSFVNYSMTKGGSKLLYNLKK